MNSKKGNHKGERLHKTSLETIVRNVNENQFDSIKVSDEEINSIESLSTLSESEKSELKDFIFNLSLVLYKSFCNESV